MFQVGSLLGSVDPQLMSQLIVGGVFVREDRFSFQAWCPRHNNDAEVPVAAATSLSFTHTILVHLSNWILELAHLIHTLKYSITRLVIYLLYSK
jgi:hypothetical protein